MELKLTVSIGATLQVKNAKGEWDWIKPEVGAEVLIGEGDPQDTFAYLWDEVVGPQFKAVVESLMPTPETPVELDATETTTEDVDEY